MTIKKKLWFISKYASPPTYGVGSRLFYVAKEINEAGFDVTLISSDSNHLAKYPETNKLFNVEIVGGVKHIWIKTKKYGASSASIKRFLSWIDFDFKLRRINKMKLEKPDVIIISSLSLTTILFGIYFKKKYKCKLVFEVRDIYPLTLTEELGVRKFHPVVFLLKWIEKRGYEKSDLIVGTMPNLVEHVNKITSSYNKVFFSPIGIPEIWNRMNLAKKCNELDDLFPEMGKNHFIVGYAGSMGKSNALAYFVEAIKRFSNIEERIFFVLVGDGDLKNTYVKELSNYKNVRFGPKINQQSVPDFLEKCDLLYLSTHKSEVWKFGQSMNKVVDYMMAGKPVIASYSGYPSMLNEAKSGVFIPAENTGEIVTAIMTFYTMDRNDRELYGKRGREWVLKHNDYKRIAKDYIVEITSLFE